MKKTKSILLASFTCFMIGTSAFSVTSCDSLIKLINGNENSLVYTLNEDGQSYSVDRPNNYGCSQVTIPTLHNGKPVTSINDYAFRDCTNLTSVIIGDSITSIGGQAFWNCSNLTNITIPNSVTSLGDYAFGDCTNLTSAVIGNSVTTINHGTFASCTNLTRVIIGSRVKTIGEGAFGGCSSLTNVTIPNSVTTIDRVAFSGCSSLTSIVIPDSVTSKVSWFLDCQNLKSVILGDGVTSFGDEAFVGCTSLTSIVIGKGITKISPYLFYNSENLNSVYYHGTVAEWANVIIERGNNSFVSATKFYYSETRPTVNGNYWHYDANGEVAVW